MDNNLCAFVFTGGHGSRLKPYTDDTPKPLMRFNNGRRIVDYVLDSIYESGITDVFMNYFYGEDLFKQVVQDYKNKLRIILLKESEPMGHGGTLLKFSEYILKYEYLVSFNGDTIINFDVNEFVEKKSRDTVFLLAGNQIDSLPKNLILDLDNNLLGVERATGRYFYNNSKKVGANYSNYVGVNIIPTATISRLSEYNGEFLGMFGTEDLMELILRKGYKVKVTEDPKISRFLSINTIDELETVDKALKLNG